MSVKAAPSALKFGCSPAYIINSIITLVIMIGFKYVVPAVDPLTPLGVEILGIFLGTLYGWLIVGDVIWPSIACLVFLGLTEFTTVTDSFASGFGNNTVLLMLFFFLFTNILNSAGIIEFIAEWIATRKVAYGKPWILSILLMIASIVCFFMVSATAACLVMIPLIKSLSTIYGFKAGDKWPMLMMTGLVYVGSTSYLILPFKSLPLIVFGVYESSTGESINLGPYMLIIAASTVVALFFFMVWCKFIVKPDVSKITNCNMDTSKKMQLTSYQKFVLGFFVVVLLLMIVPNLLSDSIFIVKLLKNIGNVGILAISIVFFLACQFEGGITINQLFAKNVSWNIIFLLAAAMSISAPFTAEETGISAWITQFVTPLVSGQSPFMFITIVCVICCILTNLANNQAVCVLFTPIIISIGTALGASLPTLIACMMAGCNVGMITPPASATGALLHGDKEWIPGKAAYVNGFICSIFNLVIAIFVIYPLGSLLL
ncbi:MAG: SLC13 family permease [Peptococcaceae bacterium]|nr:SLC13 family permease [Peptococcaceae bacterium]